MYSIALQQYEDERSKMHLLIDLVRNNPAVRSCIQRVYNEIVPTAVQVKESGKELTPDLQRFLGPWLAQFLEHALEMAYMCGFVVFVRRRHEGIEVPVLLPLGSFTWGVEVVTAKTRKRKRELACLYRYAVRPLHPELTPDDVFVLNFLDPTLTGAVLPSPMDGLLAVVRIIRNMEARLEAVVEWNSSKHIITSERVDMLKDQSFEGMSLLDSFRRYLHTGEHDGINRFYMTRSGPLRSTPRTRPTSAARRSTARSRARRQRCTCCRPTPRSPSCKASTSRRTCSRCWRCSSAR